ncbi:MAG: Na+/H+ antiporter NhaA [Ilumatobacteraceae bacterium]|nr:Na+/H+ antiporter NhaA [Ilumatobacteraceae bacterium]
MDRATRRPRSPVVRMLSPLRDFLATEASGAILLAGGAVVALVWANSPWSQSYDDLWSTRAGISVGGHSLVLDLRHWINDGLMTVFFLVVGLEIKRELTDGHLSSRRAALLPGVAALGGMLVPALVYLAIAGTSAPRGWAIPMATDIALAVGVLAVAGSRIPASLRAFLLGLAIVDDIGAIVIIAAVYSTGVMFGWLTAAAIGIVLTIAVDRLGVYSTWIYVLIGGFVWFSLHEAGIHPTIAGVAMGLLAPSTPRLHRDLIDSDELTNLSDVGAAHATSDLARGSVSVVEWLQHVLHPWTSYVVVPVFALANSGISISSDGLADAVSSPITWGVFFGLLVGKPLGVVFATRLTVHGGFAEYPEGAEPRQIIGVGAAAGIGFTVALFITELAFTDPVDQSNAKLAILVASVLAAAGSTAILTLRPRPSRDPFQRDRT